MKVFVRFFHSYMIHIIDFHPRLQMISPTIMRANIAPKARKMPAITVSAVGTWYSDSITSMLFTISAILTTRICSWVDKDYLEGLARSYVCHN
jgi:hypothetical protein